MSLAAQIFEWKFLQVTMHPSGKKHSKHAHLMLLLPSTISQERPNKPVAQQ